ncbi:putative dehydrogenase [Friedmanniella endophytica]|uniref:Putative dehydrogenase n=1 Tax=Microlunatus kandeliicorticis TaxID=1759536 RepID=A0A7W3IRX9_9ACTN|nr:Gfo/Idh/MocA family oxidoreductase [Microlunatus kandeliicorticis]MBA8794136.1 putative dehydrogenase [Microlunatus kandeliicorticis]
MSRTRYAVVGTGHRVQMYLGAIAGDHRDDAELVALLEPNPGRLAVHQGWLTDAGLDLSGVATGHPDRLEELLAAQRAERLIVTSPDFTHAGYIVRGLEAGVDVVVEKPLTIDPDGVRAIAQAVDRTGRRVVVTHNYRYSPRNSGLKQLVKEGAVGTPLSVTFEWVLDTAHGADYFRRWHRDKKNSGGLLIHKASHHFDLINWILADAPSRVFASGGVRFYGAENAERRGLPPRPPRGTHDGSRTPWELDLRDDPKLEALYHANESYDGYLRDQDVFGPGVTTEDNLALVVDYEHGATLSYALNAHSPWEGYRIAVNGTEGRAELEVIERAAVLEDEDGKVVVDPSALPEHASRQGGQRLTLQRHWQPAEDVPIVEGAGGHGGGDALLLADVFRGPGDDWLERPSDWVDGVRSVAVGMAGNVSLRTGRAVTVDELDLGVKLSR